jgi:hypothetical protein
MVRVGTGSAHQNVAPSDYDLRMRQLRPGDIVEVRPAAEIRQTLDGESALEAVPFMPEMLQYIGRRFTVSRRVEKICDTISQTGSRRMQNVVYLEDLRCDGSGHGGCQAGCRIYWKEEWLRLVDGDAGRSDEASDSGSDLAQLSEAGTRTVRGEGDEREEVWRCQATEAIKATEPLKTSDIRQYWRELKYRNVSAVHFLRVALRAFPMEVLRRFRLIGPVPLRGPGTAPGQVAPLGLRPGELVQVRSPAEIEPTLDANGSNRGLSFDREMQSYCGRTFRVQDAVKQLIDDRNGRMIHISRDCLILEGVVCSGERTAGCWFCPRGIYPYWREAWLRRVPDAEPH